MWTMIPALPLLHAAALAGERWEDGLTARAPTTPYSSLALTYAPGIDRLLFTDLRAGLPLSRPSERLTVGLDLHGAASSSWTTDDRSFTGVRSFGANLWVTTTGRERELTAHSIVFTLQTPLADVISSSWFRLSPEEIGFRTGVAYDGYVDMEGLDLSMEGRAGLSSATFLDLTWTTVLLFELGESFALGGGGTVGLIPYGTAIATARFRPSPGAELGFGISAPFLWVEEPPRSRIQPMFELKLHR